MIKNFSFSTNMRIGEPFPELEKIWKKFYNGSPRFLYGDLRGRGLKVSKNILEEA